MYNGAEDCHYGSIGTLHDDKYNDDEDKDDTSHSRHGSARTASSAMKAKPNNGQIPTRPTSETAWGFSPFSLFKSRQNTPSSSSAALASPASSALLQPSTQKDGEACQRCQKLESDLERTRWELREREKLCRALASSTETLANEKADLMSELESLSQALFQEANRMVSDERRRAHSIEVRNVELAATLERTVRVLQSTASAAAWKGRSGTTVEGVGTQSGHDKARQDRMTLPATRATRAMSE
ncbi:hypothetical protein DFJ77DRAFT_459481 [Powellomyces hirtus]|nr:hypothetical protein DFJ77DRAFT_459481 [Powellomyces hirtus]